MQIGFARQRHVQFIGMHELHVKDIVFYKFIKAIDLSYKVWQRAYLKNLHNYLTGKF